jgi:hypothetical protein
MTKVSISDIETHLDKDLNDEFSRYDDPNPADPGLMDELKRILEGCRIDVSDRIPEPESCLEIVSGPEKTMIATLGNFSAIIGKAKSKKTFLISMAISSAVRGQIVMEKFKSSLPEGKSRVLFFDTEQSRYHVQKVVRRICLLSEINEPENLLCFALRPMDTKTRIELIEYALETIPDIGLVVIDGIRDLVMDINDPKEATIIVTKLMQWTETKGIHIMTALHQNKGDTNARGHLGTEIINKAETIISVTKDAQNSQISVVEAEYLREKEFPPFAIGIHPTGVPFILHDWQPPRQGKKTHAPADIPLETHQRVLENLFKGNPTPGYQDTWRGIKLGFEELKMGFGENKAKDFLSYYQREGWVGKKTDGKRSTYFRTEPKEVPRGINDIGDDHPGDRDGDPF